MARQTVYVNLVLDSGEVVLLTCPAKFETEFHESIEATMKRRDWFSARQWDGATATFMGFGLERVNMARVVGAL